MYLRPVHAESDLNALHDLVKANPLGILTTAIESTSSPFLQSSHIPFVLDVSTDGEDADLGILRGHLARANPQAKALIEHVKSTENSKEAVESPSVLSQDIMVLFNGPAHHYVTPKFYRETKPATGKVVPTWNYSAVQVYGRATIYWDTSASTTSAFLDKQIRDLSAQCETTMGYTTNPWAVEDAPSRYIDVMKKAILGIQIKITDIGGKCKMSQESCAGDQRGVVEGFAALGTDLGGDMARVVGERCGLADVSYV